MRVYRITLEKWAGEIVASGRAARWNSNGKFVIYTAVSRALACLENVVHRGGEGLNHRFRIMTIDIPEGIKREIINEEILPADWRSYTKYSFTQKLGDEWKEKGDTCVFQVPSAIIPEEYDYLINPNHKDFDRIKLTNVDSFIFDERFASSF